MHCGGRCYVETEALVEAPQRCGGPPVALTQHLHGGGHEEGPDDGGVDEDGDGEADAELLDGQDLAGGEVGEDDDDEERGGGVGTRPPRSRSTATGTFSMMSLMPLRPGSTTRTRDGRVMRRLGRTFSRSSISLEGSLSRDFTLRPRQDSNLRRTV